MEPSKKLGPFIKESIFEEMRMIIARGNMQNLCSGYTEWDTPQFLKDLLHECIQAKENFYGRTGGQQILVKEVAKEYSPKFNREIEAEREVVITHGATGALTNVCCAFLDEGDEVIIFEPSFESYFVQPVLFGGKIRTFPLTTPKEGSDEWTIDFEEFEKLFNEKSRILLVNTPHNPTGKVLKKDEIDKIINIVKKWPRLIILTDEVYEHMCYSGNEHIRIGSYPEMWDRTISMFTASKIFSCSGWRIGWAIGPAKLVEPLMAAQTWLCLGIHRPTQNAMAKALEYVKTTPYEDGKLYYDWMRETMEKKRDKLVNTLKNCWLKIRVFKPEGGFFIMVDITESIPMIPNEYYYKDDQNKEGKEHDYSPDYAFVRWIADKYRIVCIPCFPFYDQTHTANPKEYRGSHLVRFALCKNDDTLELVEKILGKQE